ncbi:MAG: hypothetical protein ACI8SR_001722 [Oceanicoccus sp.]|jgi:uncharacterized protein (DUF1330 family)
MKSLMLLIFTCFLLVMHSVNAEELMLLDQNNKIKKAFIILQAEIVDPDMFFNQYAVPAEVEIDFYGGKPLVATFDKDVFEGEWDNNWTIILTFPSLATAKEWYNSDNYQAVLPYRHAATAFGNMVFFEGVDESKIGWNIRQYKKASVELVEPLTLDTSPDYLIAVEAAWNKRNGRFQLEATFDEMDVTDRSMSFSYRLIADENADSHNCRYPLVVSIGDPSGDLKKLAAYHDAERDWATVEYKLKSNRFSDLLESASRITFDVSSRKGAKCGNSRLEIKGLVIR